MRAAPLLLFLTTALTGCIHRLDIGRLSDEELRDVREYDLCAAYEPTGSERLRAEIDRRGLIPPEQWQRVESHEALLGMSRCAVLASLGYPADAYELGGGSTQFVYLNEMFVRTRLVEIRQGVVTRVTR